MATDEERASWRTDPDAAYAEAERRIEEARRTGAEALALNGDEGSKDALPALAHLPPLHDLPSVAFIDLDNTQVADITPIAQCKSLQRLFLNGTQVTDIAPIAQCEDLELLTLESTQVTDILLIAQCRNLRLLYLTNTQITNIAPIARCPNLHTLSVSGTQVADLMPLRGLTGLTAANSKDNFTSQLYYANTPVAKRAVFRDLISLGQPECTIQTLQYLNGEHPKYGGPPPDVAPQAEDGSPTRIVRLAAPADFKESGEKIDVKLKPVNPQPSQSSSTPVNAEARDALLAGLHGIAKELNRSLASYKSEGEGSNRVSAAEQIAGGARLIARQTDQHGEDFLAPLFHRSIEALAAAWLDAGQALEAYDREMARGLLEDARKLYQFYPVLAEIDSPTNADLIPDALAAQSDQYAKAVRDLVNSAEGRAVFTDGTREVVDAELGATTPHGVDRRKYLMRRFGALVGKMKEKVDPVAERLKAEAPDAQATANYLTISGAISQLWKTVAPYLGF